MQVSEEIPRICCSEFGKIVGNRLRFLFLLLYPIIHTTCFVKLHSKTFWKDFQLFFMMFNCLKDIFPG